MAAALTCSALASSASAQAPEPSAPDAGPVTRPEHARGWAEKPGIEGEDVALFAPRLVLFVPRIVLTAVFWPLQQGLRFAERHAVPERIVDVLYTDDRKAGVVPVFSFLSSQGPSFGAKAEHTDMGGNGEQGELSARFGGRYSRYLEGTFNADRLFGSRIWLQAGARYEVQPRLPFYGFGDATDEVSADDAGSGLGERDASVETRFRQRRFYMNASLGTTFGKPGGQVKIGATAVFNDRKFGGSESPGDVPITAVYDTSQLVGFDEGVRTTELGGTVIVDTRDVAGATSSGMYVEAFGGGVPRFDQYLYAHYGAEVTGYVNLYKKTRVLVLRGAHEGIAFANRDEVPFSDYPRLGGPNRLRGYDIDRFRDARTAVFTLEYHYPVHEFIAGSLFVDAGHAAQDYSGLTKLDRYRVGGGAGLIVRSKTSVLFTLDVAYGEGLNLYITTDPLRAFDGRNDRP